MIKLLDHLPSPCYALVNGVGCAHSHAVTVRDAECRQ